MPDAGAGYVPLVDVVRADVVESVHFGALVVVEASGRIESSLGDPEVLTYLRSAAKSFQLMPLLEHGAADEYEFGPRELAVMAASHDGEAMHTTLEPDTMPVAGDGCGAPAYAAPLQSVAWAYARLADTAAASAPAARRVADAMRQHPELVGGSRGRVDTELMRLGRGLVAKGGAEGVLCVGVPSGSGRPARGVVLKIADGDAARRARGAATAAALRQLDILGESELGLLGELARPIVRNVVGREVGQVRACVSLEL